MLDLDPPEHTRLRQLVDRGFTPKVIKSMDGHFREVADQIIGDAVKSGLIRLRHRVAAELPLFAIAELLGLPREDSDKVCSVVEHNDRQQRSRVLHGRPTTGPQRR